MNNTETKNRNPVKDALEILPENIRDSIARRINDVISYEPVIGIMGKTGAGKSSLCNAIFKGDICAVSDVAACTRETQEMRIQFGKRSVRLIDIPGVGENAERDAEYEQLYRDLLPQLDLVLWVIKGDDRAFSADEHFYKNVRLKHCLCLIRSTKLSHSVSGMLTTPGLLHPRCKISSIKKHISHSDLGLLTIR
ncbi:GTPase family protein [Enterobacter hormaechei]|uniref:GTPase family protein n=1 Tax=Enterobacter hormaechei TaxID=158836 RepID=UPI003906BBC2